MFASIKSCRPRCTNPKVGPFRFSVLHKSFSLRRGPAGTASQYSSQISVKVDITEIADTPCGRSLLAMNYSEVMFLLRLGVVQCFGDYHRSPSFLRFASSLFRLLERTLVPKFAIFSMARALRWMQAITSISLLDNHPQKKRRSTLARFPYQKDFCLSQFLFPRNFFWILALFLDRVSVHTRLL